METNNTIPTAPCRVKIIQCSYPQGWYKGLVGEEFNTTNPSGNQDYILWEDYQDYNRTWRHIGQEDCVRIPLLNQDRSPISSQDLADRWG